MALGAWLPLVLPSLFHLASWNMIPAGLLWFVLSISANVSELESHLYSFGYGNAELSTQISLSASGVTPSLCVVGMLPSMIGPFGSVAG